MKKYLVSALIVLGTFPAMASLVVGNGAGATNITSTSAWITASVTTTGAANPGVYTFWGLTNGSTNVTGWGHTNAYGTQTVGSFSFQAQGLAASTPYYFRTYATNSTETNWATYSSFFRTIQPPTTAPPASVESVTVNTNGVLKHPTNLWDANTSGLASAMGGIFYPSSNPSNYLVNVTSYYAEGASNYVRIIPYSGGTVGVHVVFNTNYSTTVAHSNLTGKNDETNYLHITQAEKETATNIISFVDGSNTSARAVNTTNITFDFKYNVAGIPLGTSNDCMIAYSNGLPAFYFWVGGVWSNAGGPER